jgi:predicted Zn-dependent protease
MKTWLTFAGILILDLAALIVSEKRAVDVPPSADAILYLVADTEQELTRLPVSFTRMSDEAEIRIGDELARANDPGRYAGSKKESNAEQREVETYLSEVGSRIAAHAHRKLPYKFHFVPEEYFINAFALPGGHVYVGAGLLALMDSEDELASVIGHEIEHIDHYHCQERVQQEMALRKIPLGSLIALPIEIFEAGYSKDQELEADREGVRLSVESGYSATGALRLFAKFDQLYDDQRHKAKSPQEELSHVAEQTIEGYFRTHPLPSDRIQQIQKLIASENWAVHPERDLRIAYIFWTQKASDELARQQYSEAEQLAHRSLALRPGYLNALKVLASAQFSQAKFRAAADSYRQAGEADPSDLALANAYARALAATADRQQSLTEFREWVHARAPDQSRSLQVSLAGLELLAGDSRTAQDIAAQAQAHPDTLPSDALSDLGWWFYLAGQYPKATEILSQAMQLRPGDAGVAERLAWADVENSRYADALQVLTSVEVLASADQYGNRMRHSDMAWAVALWRGMQDEAAIQRYSAAVEFRPEWKNAAWVRANYSAGVLTAVQALGAEQQKRQKRLAAQHY